MSAHTPGGPEQSLGLVIPDVYSYLSRYSFLMKLTILKSDVLVLSMELVLALV